jgi:hypothetical protein
MAKKPATPAWTRSEGKNPKGGLNAKGVASYRKENPGSKLKTGVTGTPKSAEEMRRKGSFLTRFYGQSDLPPLKDDKGRPTRLAKAATAWGESAPSSEAAARKLAAKGRNLLDKAKNAKKK